MSLLTFVGQSRAKRIASVLKGSLNFAGLRNFLIEKHADAGRERYRRAGLTVSASFISRALNIVISLVSVPLTVHYLGAERYGVWLTLGSVLTWMAMTDFGLAGNALVNVLSEAHGKDDRRLARQYTSSAFWTLVAMSLFFGILFLIFFHQVPWRAIFRVSAAVSTAELDRTCALALIFFVLSFPLSVLSSIYCAYQDGYINYVWGIATNTVTLVSLVIVTRFHGGLPSLVFALTGARSVVGFVNLYSCFFQRYRWLAPALSAVSWKHIKELLSLGGKYMITQLAGLGIYQSQPMIITQILGPSYVVIFVVAQKIITLPNDFVFMGTAPFISAYGEAKTRGDWKWIKGAFRNSIRASVVFGVPLTVALACVAKPLIRIWAGPAAVPDIPVILGLVLYTLVCVSMLSIGQLLVGLGRADVLAYSLSLCALATIGSGILFAHQWGLAGVAIGMALSKMTTSSPIQISKVRKILRSFAVDEPQAVPCLQERPVA